MTLRVARYNPAFLAESDLVEGFVVRHGELEQLEDVVRENIGARSNQHILITGLRGAGKTTLLRRLAIAVKRHDDLAAAWFPVVLPEETYHVTSIGDLWLEVLRALGDASDDARWRDGHDQLVLEPDRRRAGEMALRRVLDFSRECGRRILLMVENLDTVLGEQLTADDGWALRHTLQNEPEIMLVGSAIRGSDVLHDAKAATYEMFRTVELRPLDADECIALWSKVTSSTEDLHMGRPLEILTGGSPRLVAILAGFGERRSVRETMADLEQLVDDHTAYFKGIIESVPPQARKVLVTLAQRWEPSSSRQVAEQAGMDVNLASAQMGRLCERGLVREVREIGRVKLFELSERMLNLYYLLRGPGRGRVRAVVEFMVRWYTDEELVEIAEGVVAEGGTSTDGDHADVVTGLLSKRPELAERLQERCGAELTALWPKIPTSPTPANDRSRRKSQIFADALRLVEEGRTEEAFRNLEQELEHAPDDVDLLVLFAGVAFRAERRKEMVQALDRAEELGGWTAATYHSVAGVRVLAGRGLLVALRYLEQCREIASLAMEAHYVRGIAHWRLREYDEALLELSAVRGHRNSTALAEFLREPSNQIQWKQFDRVASQAADEEISGLADEWLAMNGQSLLGLLDLIGGSWRAHWQALADRVPQWIDDAFWMAETWSEQLDVFAAAAASGMPVEHWPRVLTMFEERLAPRRRVAPNEEEQRSATAFFTRAAVAGQSAQLLDVVRGTALATSLEPIVVALRWDAGEVVDPPHEVAAVARDIQRRIHDLRDRRRLDRRRRSERPRTDASPRRTSARRKPA